MGRIVITTNATLDGVVQDPDGKEGFRLGGWFDRYGGRDLEEWARVETEEALGSAALLLGRRSDEWFGTRWASRRGLWADRLNSLPKYIVSSTLERPVWSNATVLRGDMASEVAKLKQDVDGDILVYASGVSTPLRLLGTRTIGDGLAFLTYRPVRDARPEQE